ncbi:MAG TPA: NUDIX hydrolase [Firmicutes bacterium]|nr:NUDIX hydrolase [Bacillota bacterium]
MVNAASGKPAIRIRAAAVILNKKNELLLVNHVKNNKSYWLFPGGGVEYGEKISAAIMRELKEELSIAGAVLKNPVFMHETIFPQKKRHIFNIYFRVILGKKTGVSVNPEKILKGACFINREKFRKIRFYPVIKNVILKMWKKGFTENRGFIDAGIET